MHRIACAVSDHYGIHTNAIYGQTRDSDATFARQVAMALCNRFAGYSGVAVARHFDRHHTTVINAVARVAQVAAHNEFQRRELLTLARELFGKGVKL
ncbi:MAG: helix-turn-helix domain-containing protein [Pseudomonadota bacterium]